MSNILRPVRPLITPPRGAVVGLLVALASCVQGREPQGEVLKLREVFAVLVEGPGRVSLIAALSNGSYVAVGPAPGHLVVHRPPREPFLTTSPSSAPVAVSIDHDAAEVLDRIGSIFRVEGLEQDPPAAVLLREAMLLVAGTKANGEWFALSVDAAGTASLQQLDGFGGVSTILSPLPLPVGWDPYRSRITTSETRFIVSEGVFPFRRLYVGSRTLLVETFAPSVETLARDIGLPEDSLATWVALNVVELDRATLQTLADPSSDRRAILLTDGDGKAQRVLPIDAPIGFSGAAPDDETLIAVRNLGQLEVVGYRWEWREPESPPKPWRKVRTMRSAMMCLVAGAILVLGMPRDAAAQCWSCVFDPYEDPCPLCYAGIMGWVECAQPYCGRCEPSGDECGPGGLAPDGSGVTPAGHSVLGVEGSAPLTKVALNSSVSSFSGYFLRRACDGAVVARRYSAEAIAALRDRSAVLIL